jgi:hypothetical protein
MAQARTLQEAILYFSDYAQMPRGGDGRPLAGCVVKCPRCGSQRVTCSGERWRVEVLREAPAGFI